MYIYNHVLFLIVISYFSNYLAPPRQVSNISMTVLNDTSGKFSWSALDDADNYTVVIYPSPANGRCDSNEPCITETNSVIVSGLNISNGYIIEITTVNCVGESKVSSQFIEGE